MTLGKGVGAVPGSIRSAASEGTNALMAEGAFPVCSVTDILVALSLHGSHVTIPKKPAEGRSGADLPPAEKALLEVLTYEPTSLDELARITGLDFAELCGGLERLAQAALARDVGGWWERL